MCFYNGCMHCFIVCWWMKYFSYVFDKFLFGSAEYWLKSLLYLTLLAQCWCPHPNKPNSTSSNCKNGQLQSHQWLVSSTSFVSPSSKEIFRFCHWLKFKLILISACLPSPGAWSLWSWRGAHQWLCHVAAPDKSST